MSASDNPSEDLKAWLNQAWNDHAEAPQRVADALAARAAGLPDDADGAEALRLAEHVLLAHLADTAAMQRLLAAVPPGAALAPAIQRTRWALAQLGLAQPGLLADPPEALRWRALHSVVMVRVARGESAQAQRLLLAEEAAAMACTDNHAQRGYAATANNTAADLRDGPRGDPARDALMLAAAQLSKRVWTAAGTWLHAERADYQLAMCHAVLQQGAEAVAAANACLQRCEAEGAAPEELFFAHECQVHAQRAHGDTAQAAVHRARMGALLAQIGDADMHAWCAATLAKT